MKPEKAARKRRPPWRRILLLPAVLLLAVAAYFIESRSGWSDLYRAAGVSLDAPDADLLAQTSTTVTVLDVGQGDAVLIGQDGAYCLIDTGPSDAKGDLVRDLQLAGTFRAGLSGFNSSPRRPYRRCAGSVTQFCRRAITCTTLGCPSQRRDCRLAARIV